MRGEEDILFGGCCEDRDIEQLGRVEAVEHSQIESGVPEIVSHRLSIWCVMCGRSESGYVKCIPGTMLHISLSTETITTTANVS